MKNKKVWKRIIKEYHGKYYDKYESDGAVHWDWYEDENCQYRKMVDDSIAPFRNYTNVKRGTLLDLGCGDGLISYRLKEMGFEVTGVDENHIGLLFAQARAGIKTIEADLNTFMPKKEYDYAICVDTIEHLKNPENIKNILKKINKFAVIVTDDDYNLTKASVYHQTQYTKEEFEELFKGYRLEKIPMRIKYFFGYKIIV